MIDNMGRSAREAAEEKRREKARNLRYRKPIMQELNIRHIREELADIAEQCAEVQWFVDSEDGRDTLLAALNGDEDDAYEFRMSFSTLSADCERMAEDLDQNLWYPGAEDISRVDDGYDLFFVSIGAGGGDMYGYDAYEEDYFGLDTFESELAEREAKKKLMRLTKDQIIDVAHMALKVALQFVALRSRYDDLKAALDILRGQNAGYLQQVREIEEAYEKATRGKDEWERDSARFDRMLRELPDRAWIE